MWVCSWFDGDENEPLMWVQHDLYGDMLGYWVQETLAFYEQSLYVWVRPEAFFVVRESLKKHPFFDHRCLQNAHDMVAAFFRYAFATHEPLASLPPDAKPAMHWGALWQAYYECECSSLARVQPIVDAILTILAHQNTPEGYAAEDTVASLLRERYLAMLATSTRRTWKADA